MASVEALKSTFRVVWREDGVKQAELFGTRADADTFRQQVESQGNRWPRGWQRGVGYDQTPSTAPTFRAWAIRCVEARSRASSRTRDTYRRDLDRHVFPVFGDRPVDRIEPDEVGRWLIRLSDTKRTRRDGTPEDDTLSQKTVKNIHALCSSIMSEAVQEGVAVRNPFVGRMRMLPTVRGEEMCFLTRQEADTLIRCTPEHYRPLVTVLFYTGLRWGEATALAVGQVDLLAGQLTVVRAWKRTADNWYVLGEPKSRRARRTISLPPRAVEALLPLVTRPGSDFVFTTPNGLPIRHNNFHRRIWRESVARMQAAGVEKAPRIHDARHSFVSWALAGGARLEVVQRHVGHESITTTSDRYGHILPGAGAEVALALGDGPAPTLPAPPVTVT